MYVYIYLSHSLSLSIYIYIYIQYTYTQYIHYNTMLPGALRHLRLAAAAVLRGRTAAALGDGGAADGRGTAR